MDKITLSELADALAKRKSLTKKDAEAFVRVVFDTIRENLLEDELVKVKGLGTFKLVQVDSRESVHVNTGERIVIDSHSKITFTPDKSLADCVNRPFAAFETVILNDETRTEDMERIDPVEEPEPVVEEPAVEEPVAEPEPAVEEPVAEPEPVVEESVAEPEPEPVVEVPVAEPELEPVVEEPVEEPEPEPVVVPVMETVVEPEPEAIVEPEPEAIVEPEPEAFVEPEPEPIIDPEPEPVEPEPAPVVGNETPAKGNGSSSRIWLWAAILLIVAGVGYWLKVNDKLNFGPKNPKTELVAEKAEEVPVQQPEPAVVEEDSTVVTEPEQKDTTAVAIVTKADAEKLAANYPQIENGEYWITGIKTEHVLEKGEDLSILAKKYYDDKRLISYIIRMNHYTNAQASNLFVGAKVKIPELVKRN